jgi:hypothetical protein
MKIIYLHDAPHSRADHRGNDMMNCNYRILGAGLGLILGAGLGLILGAGLGWDAGPGRGQGLGHGLTAGQGPQHP